MNLEITEEKIKTMIFEIRGKQVMLDSDLARLYGCANGAKTINQAVRRNTNRFPEDFYFQITKEELLNLKSQFGTSSWNNYGGIRKLPYAFTEEGVAMLSTVLRTSNAAIVSINIMRAFVLMRKFISNELLEQKYINNMVLKHDNDIKLLQDKFNNFKISANEIYFDGQIYDAYSKIVNLMSEAQNKLVIIDRYADKKVLDMITNLKVNVSLIIKTKPLLKKLDIEKYNEQYNNLNIIYDDSFHDRYLIIDDEVVYHLGASINYIGSKTFSINRLEDKDVINLLLAKVSDIFYLLAV